MDKLKAKGLDVMLYLASFVVTWLSYSMTVELLKTVNGNWDTSSVMDFLRGSFVFLAPCAMEGFSLLCSKAKKKLDVFELIMGFASIVLSAYLWHTVTKGSTPEHFEWVRIGLLIYPLKIVVNFFSELFELLKLRRG